MTIRVGLLGVGLIGQVHARGYRNLKNAHLVAVADIDRAAADRVAAEHKAHAFYSLEQLLAEGDVDMVDVCVPTYVHEWAVVTAAAAGKHILCEKPVGRSLAEAEHMRAAVQRAGVRAMVAQVVRFMAPYVAIKVSLDRGDLGRPLAAVAARLSAPPHWAEWFRDPALSGGALLDLHIHDLDYLYHLFGRPRGVHAMGQLSPSGAWDHVLTSLDFGAVKATAEASDLMPAKFPFSTSLRVLGERGCIEYRNATRGAEDPSARVSGLTLYLPGQAPSFPACPDHDGYRAEIDYFTTCLAEGRDPELATLTQACEVLRIAMAAKESLETGRTITLDWPTR